MFLAYNTLQVLDLSKNLLTNLDQTYFVGLTNLIELLLSGNHIISIQQNAFLPLESLVLLDLSSNIFNSSLNASTFLGLNRIETIMLNSNQLTSVKTGYFSNVFTLKKLNLSHNLIKNIEANSFTNGLTELYLDENNLQVIDNNLTDTLSKSLQVLSVSNNNITSIGHSLNGLEMLEFLDLSNNEIGMVNQSSFIGLINLISLKLNENVITSLDSFLFRGLSNLKFLYVSSNPIGSNLSQFTFFGLSANLEELYLNNTQLVNFNAYSFKLS